MEAPRTGSVWINDEGMSFTVEDVHHDDDEHDNFLVEAIDTASVGNMQLSGDEFTREEWAAFIAEYRLRPAG